MSALIKVARNELDSFIEKKLVFQKNGKKRHSSWNYRIYNCNNDTILEKGTRKCLPVLQVVSV